MTIETAPLDAMRHRPTPSEARLHRFLDVLLWVQYVVIVPFAAVFIAIAQAPMAAIMMATIAIFIASVIWARRLAAAGDPTSAVIVVAIGYVPPAVATALVGAYALPVLAVATVIPATLAVPFLPRRSTGVLLATTVAFSALVAATNVLAPDDLVVLPDWFETLNVLIGPSIACALVMQLAWQNHVGLGELQDDLRRSRLAVVQTTDAERRRAERDLHDGAQQRLHSAVIQLALARRLLVVDLEAARDVLDHADAEIAATGAELDRLVRGLLPVVLVERGLRGALDDLAARAPIPVVIRVDLSEPLPSDVESAIWFCCSEAVQNATKHAGPDAGVTVEIERSSRRVRFVISDDGAGFDRGNDKGQGLDNMTTRMTSIGGRLTVESSPDHGTTVTGELALDALRRDGW